MITINADSLRASILELKGKGLEIRAQALVQYRKFIMGIFKELLLISPQYSGDFVFNWSIEIDGGSERGYTPSSGKVQALEKGQLREPKNHAGEESGELNSAYFRALRAVQDIKYYGQPVYFVNATPLEIDTPFVIGPDGVQELRDDGVTIAWVSITTYLQDRYGTRS